MLASVTIVIRKSMKLSDFCYFGPPMCGSKTEGNFQVQSPRGAYIWRGLYVEGLFFGILRYLFNPFTAK